MNSLHPLTGSISTYMAKAFLIRYICNLTLIWSYFSIYRFSRYYSGFLTDASQEAILGFAIILSALVFVFDLYSVTKKRITFGLKLAVSLKFLGRWTVGLIRSFLSRSSELRFNFSFSAKRNLLFALVKFFFIPLMIQFFLINAGGLGSRVNSFLEAVDHGIFIQVFNDQLFPLLLTLVFLIDTGVFAFGYLFESSLLQNRVRSVDPSFIGWAVALACYPPFNGQLSEYIPMDSNSYVEFGSDGLNFFARSAMILLMFVYLWATLSLGAKASNLTNRGIVTWGAYRWVRHPAYISKNIFWWLTMIPVIVSEPYAVIGLLGWNAVYLLRAFTEERHLMEDPEYRRYCEVTRYRFIPGVV